MYVCMYVYYMLQQSPNNFEMVGTEWEKVQASYPLDSQPKDVNLKLCFVGSYAYSFLVDGLKLGKDKVVRFFFFAWVFCQTTHLNSNIIWMYVYVCAVLVDGPERSGPRGDRMGPGCCIQGNRRLLTQSQSQTELTWMRTWAGDRDTHIHTSLFKKKTIL